MVHLTKSGLKFSRRVRGDVVFDQYEPGLPSHQNAIDLLPGWTGSFPEELQLTAGSMALFADPRIAWMLERMGSLSGQRILEIGPLEGMHTYMLDQQRPERIDAVEANRLCYLRCLVTREILRISSAHFHLGDALHWLKKSPERYDLIVASGVLYHMSDPIDLLELLAARSDAVFLWTHYFPDDPQEGERWRKPFSGKVVARDYNNMRVRLHERSYKRTSATASFCGGPRDRHYWMNRTDLLMLLTSFGFKSIEVMGEERDHRYGPCFSLLARRTS